MDELSQQMPMKSISFAGHTREELRLLAPTTLVVLPLGATEQHGPHLPVGTDYYTVEHLGLEAAKAAAKQIPVVVAPALPYGCSEHHLPFGATLSLQTEVYYRVVCDLLRSLALDGFRSVFLLNGHGGNHELIQLAARDTALKHPILVGAASYWHLAWEGLVGLDAHQGAGLPGHAGRFETSVMLALRGPMVSSKQPHRDVVVGSDPNRPTPLWRNERHGSWQAIDGYTDSPDNATAELGERYLPVLIDSVARTLIEFYRSAA